MASFNKVILMGNLTRDPDLRTTPSGATVCELGLAMNRRFVSNGQEREESCFVDVTVWGKTGENCKRFLEKGSPLLIEGRLQYDQWEDREGGGKRSKLRVVAETVQFLGGRRDGAGAPASGGDASYAQGGYQQSSQQGGYPPQGGGYGAPGGYQPQGGNYGGGQQGGYQQSGGSRGYEPRPYARRNDAPPAPPAPPAGNPPPMPDAAFNPGMDAEENIPF